MIKAAQTTIQKQNPPSSPPTTASSDLELPRLVLSVKHCFSVAKQLLSHSSSMRNPTGVQVQLELGQTSLSYLRSRCLRSSSRRSRISV